MQAAGRTIFIQRDICQFLCNHVAKDRSISTNQLLDSSEESKYIKRRSLIVSSPTIYTIQQISLKENTIFASVDLKRAGR